MTGPETPRIYAWDDLAAALADNYSPIAVRQIEAAWRYAEAAHQGQFRLTGEPYISHPLAIAVEVAKLKLDRASVIAALLHDVVEDTPISLNEIKRRFGGKVAELIDGLTKLNRLPSRGGLFVQGERRLDRYERQMETYRKLFLATSKDLRVIILKLLDRLHNMRTLSALPPEKQQITASETMAIFAPIAYRLGIGSIKGELEDLSFSYLEPQAYAEIKSLLKREGPTRTKIIDRCTKVLARELKEAGIEAQISGRAKHYYSLFRKLPRYQHDISQIYDLVACRVVVKDIESCYRVLGTIHQRWQPIAGRVKDYIAQPKPNGYRSLHTTVKATDNRAIEIQIRTERMHQEAEYGVAAHWFYHEQKGAASYLARQVEAISRSYKWVNELARKQRQVKSLDEFEELMKIDFFGDRIFVYTPKGEVIDLPAGATPIDFAYAIHTDIGNQLTAAKVNGRLIRLSDPLASSDTVELIINRKSRPKADWLRQCQTGLARAEIRQALKKGPARPPA